MDLAQEWLEATADAMMRAPDATLTFRPDIPHVTETGWRIPIVDCSLRQGLYGGLNRPELVEFYAVFADGRKLTTRRPVTDMVRETAPDPDAAARCASCGHPQSAADWELARHARMLLFERDEARLRTKAAEAALRNVSPTVVIPRGGAREDARRRALRDGEWTGFAGPGL